MPVNSPRSRTSFQARFYLRAALTVIVSGAFFGASLGTQAEVHPRINGHEPEIQLVKTLQEIQANRLDAALAEIDSLIARNPNFRLAHLIKGDLLLARARPIDNLGSAPGAPKERIEELREEAKVRLARYQEQLPKHLVPKYLLQMQPQQKFAVVVDTSRSRLYLYQNVKGEARYVTDYYISSGKNGAEKIKEGDQKTPVGVYFVTANLPRQKLTDFYGVGAFPISYPNEWDRREGRNGHGIWLHGTPSDTYSRPPRSSNGCVVLANQDLDTLGRTFQVGLTPVIITSEMEWTSPDVLRHERQTLIQTLEGWRKDWESLSTGNYLKHYSKRFSTGEQTLSDWSRQKHDVNARKSWIKVRLANVSMFFYPGKENLAVVNFEQDYSSSNLSNRMNKRQYWIKEGDRWSIVYEGGA